MTERLPADPHGVAEHLERELCRAFQYHQARLLGQLGAVQLAAVPDLGPRLEQFWIRRGLKWGDIKQVALLSRATSEELSLLLSGARFEPRDEHATAGPLTVP